jgi:CRP/FNR family transcriptional regulator
MNTIDCRLCEFKSTAASHLKSDELDSLRSNCAQVNFKSGDTIFKQDALSSNIIYIQTGFVKIHMAGPERESILRISKAPTYLGIPTTMGDRINHYSATALTEVTACFIDINAFKEFIYRNGNFAYEIILELCRNELYHFHNCVNLTQKQLNGRIAGALLFIADNIFRRNQFDLILSRLEFANMVGSSRESLSRVLNQFHEDKIINMNGKYIELVNRKALELISKNG